LHQIFIRLLSHHHNYSPYKRLGSKAKEVLRPKLSKRILCWGFCSSGMLVDSYRIFGATYRPSVQGYTAWPLKTGPISSLEKSAPNYQSIMDHIPAEWTP